MMDAARTDEEPRQARAGVAASLKLAAGGPSSAVAPPEPGLGGTSAALCPEAAARFRGLVDAHFDFVWRYLRGLGIPPAHADDAAQQVLLVVAQKLDAIVVGSERAFMVSTAHGVAANARRAIARRRESSDDTSLATQADAGPGPEEMASSNQARALLDQILASLPEELRAVFVLFELEGLTTAAIAGLLSLPAGTVASRLRRAREEFQARTKRFQAARPAHRGSP